MEEQSFDMSELVVEKLRKTPPKKDKSKNTPEFNRKAKERRKKAKTAKQSRKANRGK